MIRLTTNRTRTAKARPSSTAQRDQREAGRFLDDAPVVMKRLQEALAGLLRAAPAEITKAVHVERAFGIDHQTGWQVYQVVAAENPLAANGQVPGRTAMQRLFRAATRKRVPADVVAKASDAFDAFERLVTDHAGDRATLAAMLGTFLPEEREKAELAAKLAAFKGMSHIRGFAIESELYVQLLAPAKDPTKVDWTTLRAVRGLRRVDPGASVSFGYRTFAPDELGLQSLDGRPMKGPDDLLMPQFCSSPLPHFETQAFDDEWSTFLVGNDVGLRSGVDIVMAEHAPGFGSRYREATGSGRRGVGLMPENPLKRITFDVLVHRDVYPNAAAELSIYEGVSHGVPRSFDDPKYERNRLHMHERVMPLSGDLQQIHLPHEPRYAEMLAHVCEKLGLDPKAFRGYRLDVQYPVYGTAYMIGFKAPDAPSAST